MPKLIENTIVVHPKTSEPVLLAATGELPGWAVGLVGEHLLDGAGPPAGDGDEVARLKARIAELEAGKAPSSESPHGGGQGSAVDGYDDRKADELRGELAARKLPTSGARADLIDRLRADDQAKAGK